jgi:signal peptidase I
MIMDKLSKIKERAAVDTEQNIKRKSTFREYAEAIGMALLLALFIRTFIVQAFKIPSGSMIPTLQIGDHILVNKLSYGVRIPFGALSASSESNGRRDRLYLSRGSLQRDFIKRVIGVAMTP